MHRMLFLHLFCTLLNYEKFKQGDKTTLMKINAKERNPISKMVVKLGVIEGHSESPFIFRTKKQLSGE